MNKTGFALLAIVAALAYLCLWITDQAFWQGATLEFGTLRLIRLALVALACVLLLAVLVACVARSDRSLAAKRTWSAILASGLTLLLLEAAFMFVPVSHNVGYTLAARVWNQRYWQPLNSLGYRDREHVRIPGRRLVFAVGDSFTAGDGIARIEDRFTDRLAMDHPDLQVLNLGRRGSDAAGGFRRLTEHPLEPDVLILQYYLNDIEGTARRAGWSLPEFTPHRDLTPRLSFLVRNSFLLDFAYWRFPHTDGLDYVRFLERALHDEALCRLHLDELEQFVTLASKRGIPLILVVFPVLQDPAVGRPLAERIMRFCESRSVRVLDVAGLVEDIAVPDRTVNASDAHPSVRVHHLVAEALGNIMESI